MLQAGIVGLPNVGKSTLFNALTNNHIAEAGNFPFCTIDPNISIVNLPDEKLQILAEIEKSEKIIYAPFQLVDIAGLVKGASEGAGLGNKFLSNIREVDAIVHVLRCFEDENIHHVDVLVDPVRDFQTILMELALADLSVIERRIEKQKKLAKSADKEILKEIDILEKIRIAINNVELDRITEIASEDLALLKPLNLLSLKPFLIAANLKEDELANPNDNKHFAKVKEYFQSKCSVVPISAQIESELVDLDQSEVKEYLDSLGVKESGVKALIKETFSTLGLMTYYTVGQIEARAWTIKKGCKAPEAAGVIHTDFEKGFIKAEVISFDDLIKTGSKQKTKEIGKMRLEGKEYIVQESDIMEFKFNV